MNLPTIPDNINKITFILSIVLIYYGITNLKLNLDSQGNYLKNYRIELKEKYKPARDLKVAKDKMLWLSQEISSRTGTLPFVTLVDSVVTFRDVSNLSTLEDSLYHSIRPVIIEYINKKLLLPELLEELESDRSIFDSTIKVQNAERKSIIWLLITGSILMIISFYRMESKSNTLDRLALYELREKGEIYANCQSCGKKFNAILLPGTNLNGEKNFSFCNNCYRNGVFTQEDTDAYKEVMSHINSQQISSIRKSYRKFKIKNLDRWRGSEY